MPRQPLVDERVVRGQQVEDAAVLAHDAVEEQLRLAPERLPQVVVEVRELVLSRAPCSAGCAAAATGPAKLSTSASRLRVGQHPPHLLLEHRRLVQSSRARHVSSSSSGMLLHRKNDSRDASSRSLIAIRRARRRRSAGSRSTRNDELRARQDPRSASSTPARTCRSRSGRCRRTPAGASARRRVTGRRYARRASVERIVVAHGRLVGCDPPGRQTKMRRAARRVAGTGRRRTGRSIVTLSTCGRPV